MHLAPVPPRPSAVDVCAQALRQAILRGQVAPGERLPPERTLATSFGVNRVTVRGALVRLEAEGLVSPRQGSGYTVHDYLRVGGPDLIGSLLEIARGGGGAAEITGDLLLVRRQIARAVFERLAELRALDTAPIAAAIAAFSRVVEAGGKLDELAEADLAVAHALVQATGSKVLQLCMNPVTQMLRALPSLARAMYAHPKRNMDAYAALTQWLHKRDQALIEPILEVLAQTDVATLRALRKGRRS